MCHGLIRSEKKSDASSFLQLREECLSGIQIGSMGIGGVGPDRGINDFCRIFCVHVQSGFHAVGFLAGFAIAVMADRGRLVRAAVLMFENTMEAPSVSARVLRRGERRCWERPRAAQAEL